MITENLMVIKSIREDEKITENLMVIKSIREDEKYVSY